MSIVPLFYYRFLVYNALVEVEWEARMQRISQKIESMPRNIKVLFEVAATARGIAYAPYSNFRVGAVIELSSGLTYHGCNVENASYGMTICAERCAVFKAVSSNRDMRPGSLKRVFVVTDPGAGNPPAFPCGGCRSVLAEFSTPDTEIYVANIDGSAVMMSTMQVLLPNSFEMQFAAQLAKK